MENALGPEGSAEQMALLGFAEELFAELSVELCGHGADLRTLISEVEGLAGLPSVLLGHRALRNPRLLTLPTAVAIEVELELLLAFADGKAVSLWILDDHDGLERIAQVGGVDLAGSDTQQAARRASTSVSEHVDAEESISEVLVGRWPLSRVALVARGPRASSASRALLLESAVPMLAAVLASDERLSRSDPPDRSALDASARLLNRMRFDLHDGPQQDVIMLAEDLRFFGEQLAGVVADTVSRDRIHGRIEDLQARLVAVDADLRRISSSLQSPFLQSEPLPDAIAKLAGAFAERTMIQPQLELQGELTGLTDSQQITLLALIREALANIRDHSRAEHVKISLSAGPYGVQATVIDDGHGFDPETTLVTSARDGHLGLVGMYERVRMLGGETKIDSRPGGPTVISVELPPWPAVKSRGN